MAKTLKDFLAKKNPLLKSKADQEFYKKNVSSKVTKLDKATENDDQFKANNVKTWKRAPLHGVDGEEDSVSDGTNLNEASYEVFKDDHTVHSKHKSKSSALNTLRKTGNRNWTVGVLHGDKISHMYDHDGTRLNWSDHHGTFVPKKSLKESDLNEISKKTLKSYISGASIDKSIHAADIGYDNASGVLTGRKMNRKEFEKIQKKHGNRSLGIQQAAERLAGDYPHKGVGIKPYKLKEDTLNEIKVGDHIHAGLGTKGGAGFKGVVTKVEGNTVHFRQHEKYAKGNKFGPRQFKAPKSLVTVEKKNLSESTKKEALKRYHAGSNERLNCIKGLLKKFHDNQLKSSYHDLWSTKDIHRRIEDLHDDLVGRTDIPNVKSTLHENQLDEISKKTLTSYIRKSMNDRDWKRSERLDIARNSMNPSIYRERDDYKKVAREGGNRSRGIDRALDRLGGEMKYGKTSHQEKISYGKGRPPKNAPKEKTVTKFKTKEYTAKE